MKHGRFLFLAVIAACMPLAASATVSAAALPAAAPEPIPDAPQSISRELHVKAKVPGHRSIILGLDGRIQRIISNTSEDVTPTVYTLDTIPENMRPLSDEMFKDYRKLVPAGTAKYGTLYDRQASPIRLTSITGVSSAPAYTPALLLAPNTQVRDLLIAVR